MSKKGLWHIIPASYKLLLLIFLIILSNYTYNTAGGKLYNEKVNNNSVFENGSSVLNSENEKPTTQVVSSSQFQNQNNAQGNNNISEEKENEERLETNAAIGNQNPNPQPASQNAAKNSPTPTLAPSPKLSPTHTANPTPIQTPTPTSISEEQPAKPIPAPGITPIYGPPPETKIETYNACIASGGTWRTFPNSCVDSCILAERSDMMCLQVLTDGCDCGVSMCWNGSTCVQNPPSLISSPKPGGP